jgi:hypothetical protein
MNVMIIAIGITVLIGLGILVGVSMDTEAQRVEWREVAHERRERREELAALQQERKRLRLERRRLEQDMGVLRNRPTELCERCPLRRVQR